MAVLPLLLGREENAVYLSAPLLLREMNAVRGCRMKHGTVSLVFFFAADSFVCLPTYNCWANLACKVIEKAEDDRARIVDVNGTYRGKKKKEKKIHIF